MVARTRKEKEVEKIMATDAVGGYSILVPAKLCNSAKEFLVDHGVLIIQVEENAIGGAEPEHDIQAQKTMKFGDFIKILQDWKQSHIES